MSLGGKLISHLFSGRLREIERCSQYPFDAQQQQLKRLLEGGCQTTFGRERGLERSMSIDAFQSRVEVCHYEGLHSYIERAKAGESDLLWPGEVKWFAKSSGTTNAKSKYIPVTEEALQKCHYQGPRDLVAIYASKFPETRVYGGKTLTLGGSRRIEHEGETAVTGDLSAILIGNTPWWANMRRVPSAETALIPDFEQKIARICEETVSQDVRSFAGVPSWNLVMMNKILEYTGKDNLLEIWPNLELFIHGGMSFKPYREQYKKIIPSPQMQYMETYNASEGFFAIGDDVLRDDMLLMLDYHVFYEFLPMSQINNHSATVPLEGVQMGVNYAMIITSCNGLWRYMIGDTVEFTSTAPFRIKITGRTKHYVNAFGEEVGVDNAETAIRAACDATGAEISEFTLAPIFMEGREKGAHEWVVEFAKMPDSVAHFGEELDLSLQGLNSDYEAKRFKSVTLMSPKITVVAQGTFVRWMRSRGAIGGQNKVPRLFNDRTYVDELLKNLV